TNHAVFWPGRTDLGTLGRYSWARAVNAQREVAGESASRTAVHAFFVAAPGALMQDLGVLRGDGESHALGISDVQMNGTRFVVGTSVGSGSRRTSSAVVWTVGP